MDKEVNARGGEGRIWRGRRFRKEIIILRENFGGGLSWSAQRRVEFCSRIGSVQALVCWRFWAWGLGYPYDILELGSCPSWQGGTRFWVVFTQFSNSQQGKWKAGG